MASGGGWGGGSTDQECWYFHRRSSKTAELVEVLVGVWGCIRSVLSWVLKVHHHDVKCMLPVTFNPSTHVVQLLGTELCGVGDLLVPIQVRLPLAWCNISGGVVFSLLTGPCSPPLHASESVPLPGPGPLDPHSLRGTSRPVERVSSWKTRVCSR